MKSVLLIRHPFIQNFSTTGVIGNLLVLGTNGIDFSCKTIENKDKLCAEGTFPIVFEHSAEFKMKLWELYQVQGRSEIKIHIANYYSQLKGCIGIGRSYDDINNDSILDVVGSADTLSAFHLAMGSIVESQITIISYDKLMNNIWRV